MAFFLPGDYNKDGNIDFVTNGKFIKGDGTGKFTLQDIDMGSGNFTYGASGDMNGDGYLDLVVGDHLNVLINNGDGTFNFDYSIFPDTSVHLLNINDYNKDGYPDLVIEKDDGNETTATTYYIPSTNNMVFGEPTVIYGFYLSFEYTYFPIQQIDFNKDGNLDIYIYLERSGYNGIYLGDGKGNFTKSWGFNRSLEKYSVMDIDNDSTDDIVILSFNYNSEQLTGILSYYPGHNDGTFGENSILYRNLPHPSMAIASGDFNKDGLLDFAMGTEDSVGIAGLSVFLSNRITEVKENKQTEEVSFLNCFPNPFNATTTFSYSINSPGTYKLAIYSINGQKVATLVDGPMSAGAHSVTFNGSRYASGVYFYRFESAGMKRTGKMLLLK
jgi:hypothetical protein